MTTGEGEAPRDGQAPKESKDERDRGGQRIGVGANDDTIAKIQLAARWAEAYAPREDSLATILKRFRGAFEYLDAVIHGVEPPEMAHELSDARPATGTPVAEPAAAPSPGYAAPEPSPEQPEPQPTVSA